MRLLGILLVVFGGVLLIYGGLTFFIPADVFNLGNITVSINRDTIISLPPLLGLGCLLVGFVLMLCAPRRYYGPPPY
jgi:hypothetical protein